MTAASAPAMGRKMVVGVWNCPRMDLQHRGNVRFHWQVAFKSDLYCPYVPFHLAYSWIGKNMSLQVAAATAPIMIMVYWNSVNDHNL